MAKREPRIRRWMKRNNIADERFRIEWVSAGEGKKWQGIMKDLSDIVEKQKLAKPAPKPKTKSKTKAKSKTTTKKTTNRKAPSRIKPTKKSTKTKKKPVKK
jgi:hypothetical protein